MQKMTIAQARRPKPSDMRSACKAGSAPGRDSKGGFSFLELNDGSSLGNIQVVADGDTAELRTRDQAARRRLQRQRRGLVRRRRPRGRPPKSRPTSVVVHGWADPETYPLQKKQHSFEFLRTIAHLRPRTNTFGAIARVRNCVCRSIHDFFQEQGFLYVHTPIITASDCEGAGEMFQVTTLEPGQRCPRPRRRRSISRRTSSSGPPI